jgi:uncharacterized OsmC-like protein
MRLKKKLHYEASAKWDKETGGTVDVDGFNVTFDTPRDHGGNETAPCPDQLFLASLTGCLVNTFLYYKTHLGAETRDLKVNAEAEIELTNPLGYRMTGIIFEIHVWSDEENNDLNVICAERARDYCHLTKSIEQAIPIKIEITIHKD